ncbi:fungal-specific transcription factor domain-containing protein [Aspergillus ambiguus]|uniref:Zn(II)2Cys6 transcription factor n=1 Tax=Aspergillus ambiguus TaxID=176160 RepID=UPI003CCCEF9C
MPPPASGQSRKSSTDPAPRKRRKRTVVTGAREDCFTCAREGLACDRSRPFCSQCLGRGLECSGYKTTLTWGVGVASRGKLRGLAVPIKGAGPAAPSPESTHQPPRAVDSQSPSESGTSPSLLTPNDHFVDCVTPAFPQSQWLSSLPDAATEFDSPLQPCGAHYTDTCNTNPDDIRRAESSNNSDEGAAIWTRTGGGNSAGLDLGLDGHGSDGLPENNENATMWMNASPVPSFSQLLLTRSVGHTPRLQYLISYYAEVIAPMIIAFDSPKNPFRTCILRLAQDNIALQEAIAALSVSNIRRRRERKMLSTERTLPAKMSSLAHQALADIGHHSTSEIPDWEDMSREEQYHRGRAVSALNLQLADRSLRLSDSVLATLLILCLFHGCDTGVAQFKTQFAGVMKLLAIRLRNSPHISEDLKWFIRIFTWYDTMTAVTNDREVVLRGTFLQIASSPDDEQSLVTLTGCDAQVFRFVAQLGRLNLLSQNKEVTAPTLSELFQPSAAVPPSMAYTSFLPATQKPPGLVDSPSCSTPNSGNNDVYPSSPVFWAEWHSLRQKLESWRPQPLSHGLEFAPDDLFAGSIGMNPMPMSRDGVQAQAIGGPQDLQDVYYISECFRHAALLYTERLGHPHLPSCHPQIQNLVNRTMQYIALVKSDVYLLWPLFIAGSESVLETHRAAIRQRCRDISRDSGFLNNLSCLEVLEKIWLDDSRDGRLKFSPEILNGVNPVLSADTVSACSGSNVSSDSFPRVTTERKGLRWHQVMKTKWDVGEYMVV